MAEKQEVVVAVIDTIMKKQVKADVILKFGVFCLVIMISPFALRAQKPVALRTQKRDSVQQYKKRVLDATEVDFITSYYTQDGDNAAVSGGIGSEKLTDFTPTFVVSMPLNDDDVLTIDAGVSAYTSASSSNVNPFDGSSEADPFQASSGASSSDVWVNLTTTYTHSSDDRNRIWSAKASVSSEYDYFSVGFGGSYAWLFNEKNTEVSVHGNIYLDTWNAIYPIELRPFAPGGAGLDNPLFDQNIITGNENYSPQFQPLDNEARNSYSAGLGFSQILSERMQGSLALDLVWQDGLLSTPFQRVYFNDVDASFINQFRLADDIERLPDTRFKVALGGRLNYYISEKVVARSFYRYYTDDWGINSHTASIELPVKLSIKFTLYPSYRYYFQSAADYFGPYAGHVSTQSFYTSDYDLSEFSANQVGFGISYTDIFTNFHLFKFGLKSIDLKVNQYKRNTGLQSTIISAGFKFVVD
jgi:hypothetical protein